MGVTGILIEVTGFEAWGAAGFGGTGGGEPLSESRAWDLESSLGASLDSLPLDSLPLDSLPLDSLPLDSLLGDSSLGSGVGDFFGESPPVAREIELLKMICNKYRKRG